VGKAVPSKINYEKLATGYQFAPSSFRLDSQRVRAYLKAVEDHNSVYAEQQIVPPMAIAALAMAAMFSGLDLPPGAIHVSQSLEFVGLVRVGEELTSYARVSRKTERGKFHLLTIGIDVLNKNKVTVLSGETSFILPLVEEKQWA
jgi:acyl dehydratase